MGGGRGFGESPFPILYKFESLPALNTDFDITVLMLIHLLSRAGAENTSPRLCMSQVQGSWYFLDSYYYQGEKGALNLLKLLDGIVGYA